MFPTTITQALELLRTKKITARQLVDAHIERIEKEDKTIEAFTETCFEQARKEADILDASGDFSAPLAGIPFTLKDVISVQGMQNTAGSKMLEGYIPPYDAIVTKRLKQSGAILLGKVNTDEFTMGSSCETSALCQTKNPWNTKCVPGGSSGGSAAAVAKYMGMFSIGTDTGGSIRQPANFCGITGLKVTYGRVPRYGVIPYASSFDTIGPIAPTVEDCAKVLEVIAGHAEEDATTPKKEVLAYSTLINKGLSGKKIGIIKEFLEAEGLDNKIRESFQKTVEIAKQLGAEIIELSLPLTKYAIPTYYLLVKAEASTNLARFDGIRFGQSEDEKNLDEIYKNTRSKYFGHNVKLAIMMGTYTLSAGYYDAYYKKAAKVRTLFKQEYEKAFEQVDVIFAPVSPMLPFQIGEKIDDPLAMYLADIFTVTPNLAGITGLSVPTELIDGLPTGIQILGKMFNEAEVLNAGKAIETAVGFTEIREKAML